MTGGRFDIHQHITDQILALLDQATVDDFRLPWHGAASATMRPANIASNKAYRGINVLALWAAAEEKGYSSGIWGTYRQWAGAKAQVRKGEKATFVVFYKEVTVSGDHADETETRAFARATPVFSAEQVDGWTPPAPEAPQPIPTSPIDEAETFIAATGASIVHGGLKAFYRRSTDSIHIPPREAFTGTETSSPAQSYYSVLLHELTHWTSHESRCNRQLGKRFGDDAYAMEELVAELGAAFLCADLGIASQPRLDHAQYLKHWLRVMQADKKAIFTAASKASEATAFLSSLQKPDYVRLNSP
ncbi:MAG: zincin-like metallopeptidase domain-containing protein [Bradyrhizobium sp.]|nr:zincin-like metallopeptidase domain-containing protein [Bradyrhizobium sp.]